MGLSCTKRQMIRKPDSDHKPELNWSGQTCCEFEYFGTGARSGPSDQAASGERTRISLLSILMNNERIPPILHVPALGGLVTKRRSDIVNVVHTHHSMPHNLEVAF